MNSLLLLFKPLFLLYFQKETDLELAARIGQQLLEKNKVLHAKNEDLEEHFNAATEKVLLAPSVFLVSFCIHSYASSRNLTKVT